MRRGGALLASCAVLVVLGVGCGHERYVLEDHDHFSPPIAGVDSPTHYMGVYLDDPVPYTRTSDKFIEAENELGGQHAFWNIGLGESFTLIGATTEADAHTANAVNDHNLEIPRSGHALVLDADIHMLLDFFAHSIAVLNTDFRIGLAWVGRGFFGALPAALERRVSWKLKVLHESTHIGDEYTANAVEEQLGENPDYIDFERVNVAFEAAELTASIEDIVAIGDDLHLHTRGYIGYRFLFKGPWADHNELATPTAARRHEGRIGAELRLPLDPRSNLEPTHLVFASEFNLRRQYDYDVAHNDGRLLNFNGLLGWEWVGRTSTFRSMLNGYHGINPRGQFRDGEIGYLGVLIQLDL